MSSRSAYPFPFTLRPRNLDQITTLEPRLTVFALVCRGYFVALLVICVAAHLAGVEVPVARTWAACILAAFLMVARGGEHVYR